MRNPNPDADRGGLAVADRGAVGFNCMPITRFASMSVRVEVAFVEAGRVADDWELDELHSDMKFSFGAGVRLSVRGLIVRVDLAGSEEGAEIQMFIGHTFD